MKHLLLVMALASVPVLAAGNPSPQLDVIVFDMGDGSNCICPQPDTPFTVTAMLARLDYAENGIRQIAFSFHRTFGGDMVSATNLLGGTMLGDPESGSGCMLLADDCVLPNETGFIPLVSCEYLYTGVPGVILPHGYGTEGARFVDCAGDTCYWMFLWSDYGGNAGICMDPPYGCGVVVPVENATWGSIKALYR
jgi:hypothetical protein